MYEVIQQKKLLRTRSYRANEIIEKKKLHVLNILRNIKLIYYCAKLFNLFRLKSFDTCSLFLNCKLVLRLFF